MDILKFVESLPDSIKNLIVSALLNSSVAMKNVEQDIRTIEVQPTQLQQGQQRYRRQSPANLLESMRQGEYNAEYADYFYEVLRKADDLVNNSTPEQLKLLAERYGMGNHATARYNFLEKNNRQLNGNKTPQQVRREEINRRVTSNDNFPMEMMVTNRKHIQNVLEHSIGGKPIYKYSIMVQRMFQTQYNIEQITEHLHVKHIQSEHNGRLLEFYIPKQYGLKNLQHTNPSMFDEICNISDVSFNDNYGQRYNYKVHRFYKIGENGMFDVIKLKGHRIENMGFY